MCWEVAKRKVFPLYLAQWISLSDCIIIDLHLVFMADLNFTVKFFSGHWQKSAGVKSSLWNSTFRDICFHIERQRLQVMVFQDLFSSNCFTFYHCRFYCAPYFMTIASESLYCILSWKNKNDESARVSRFSDSDKAMLILTYHVCVLFNPQCWGFCKKEFMEKFIV